MITDLNLERPRPESLECDVLVVGAGIAGLIVATELAARHHRVIVLESGGLRQTGETHELNKVVQIGQRYEGAEHGRFRCLGGTSTRWGGAMIPFQPCDFGPHTAGWPVRWPLALDELLPYMGRIERLFGLPSGPYDAARHRKFVTTSDFTAVAPKWPSVGRRNLAELLKTEVAAPTGPSIWINATLTGMCLGNGGRVSKATARSPSGNDVVIAPSEVVVAAGAIESTRLLLQLDADHGNRLFSSDDVIGRYFHDHLSTEVAHIHPRNQRALNTVSGFWFEGRGMRSMRFELSSSARSRHRLPGSFAHISFSTPHASGFDGLRESVRAVQRGQFPSRLDLLLVFKDAPWFARALWCRLAHARVLPPDNALYELMAVTEQRPLASNRISLSQQQSDRFGIPLAQIDWRVSDEDVSNVSCLANLLVTFWKEGGLSRASEIELKGAVSWKEQLCASEGIFHPGGTLRMASGPASGVVDAHLRAFRVPNLRVVSTATFPSGGGGNPTLTLMLLALRTVDDISNELQRRR